MDAVWTPRNGNIVYTAKNKRVVVMSKTGKIITTHPLFKKPQSLSTSNNTTIYLADFDAGIYQSIDDGVNWSFVFKSPNEWYYLQAIKLNSVQNYAFCTLEIKLSNKFSSFRLRLCSFDRESSSSKDSETNLRISSTNGKPINLLLSKLSCSGTLVFFQ